MTIGQVLVVDGGMIMLGEEAGHHGLSLTAVAGHLDVTRQSIARGLARAERVFAGRGSDLVDFLESLRQPPQLSNVHIGRIVPALESASL